MLAFLFTFGPLIAAVFLLGAYLGQLVASPHRRLPEDADGEGEPKMVLIFRKDMKLKCAAAAAVGVDAAIGVLKRTELEGRSLWNRWVTRWETVGVAKVSLQCPDLPALKQLRDNAAHNGLPCFVADARSEPAVLAIGPAPASLIDTVSGHLKLL